MLVLDGKVSYLYFSLRTEYINGPTNLIIIGNLPPNWKLHMGSLPPTLLDFFLWYLWRTGISHYPVSSLWSLGTSCHARYIHTKCLWPDSPPLQDT